MNAHDSERMDEVLRSQGWNAVENASGADLIVFNTCSVREKAEQKLRSEVGKLAPLKRSRPDIIIAVAGCVAQQEGDALLKRITHLDIVIGPDNIAELPALVRAQVGGAPAISRAVFDISSPYFLTANPEPGRVPVSTFVTTMKGCDERCSFCVVPYTRGPERYRPATEIVAEIERLVDSGAREIVLLGQTVDSYRDASLPPPVSDDPDESQFPSLLRLIANSVPKLSRLRYTSPHPRHATASLAAVHGELDVLAQHVHLPVQSGSDRILKRMIRRYTRAEFVARAERLRSARPGMTLSTDIIVGFPGETDDDFEQTLSLVREIGFTSLYGFSFSPRPLTPALRLHDDVPKELKRERLARLFAVAEEIGQAHLKTLVGTRQQVLVERSSKGERPAENSDGPRRFEGRTARNEIVHISIPQGSGALGEVVDVDIVEANKHSLEGVLTESARERLPADRPTTWMRRGRVSLPIMSA